MPYTPDLPEPTPASGPEPLETPQWRYADWRRQSGAAAKLERLRLHQEEVDLRITESVSGGGQSLSTDTLNALAERLREEERRLERGVSGEPSSARVLGYRASRF